MNIRQYLYKVQPPTLPTPILHREALVHLLARCLEQPALTSLTPPKLILLCAPAGYGKTTLLVDTMLQTSATYCWYFFESIDTPAIFLKSLLASIQQCFPEIGNHLAAFSELDRRMDGEVDWEEMLDLLVETLNSQIPQHFILALCNYHAIKQNKVLNRLIDHLLAHPPLRAVLVIESRSLPDLNLAPLIAHRQMFGIGSNKLRFTAQELYELAHLQGFATFSWSEAEYLTNSFEGWIAGILLGSSLGYTQMHPLAPSHKGNWGELAQLADRQPLAAYIADEIFSQETATYEFLEAVSVLNQLTPARCDALLGSTDAAQRLIYAEQQGLFVVRGEQPIEKDDVGFYICHPVLRELFEEKLRTQSFDIYLELHRKAAYLLHNDQMYEQALIHALQAQEYSLAINIITQVAPDLVIQGESKIVDLWLNMLPKQILKQDPWILMILINIHLTRNEYAQVPPLLEAVRPLLETAPLAQNQKGSSSLRAEMGLARSKLLFYQGDFQRSRELCQEILRLLPADEIHLRMRTHHRLGVCLVVGLGHIHEGIVQFQQALQLSTSQNDERQTATLYRLLASAYGWIGNYSLADYHQERALGIWEKLHEPWGLINSLTSMGLLKLRQGLTQKAEEILLRALHLARDYHFRSGEAYALVALGELCCTMAQYIRALAYLEDGLYLARQCEDRYLIHCGLYSIATTYLHMGEIQTSQFFLGQISLHKQEDSTYEGILLRLTQGRLSLAQQVYEQAQSHLEYAVTLGKATNIRFLHVQSLLLLVVCYIRKNELGAALHILRQVLELNRNDDFTYTLEVEARYYPELSAILAQIARIGQVEMLSARQVFPDQTQTLSASSGTTQASFSSLRILAFGEPKVLINNVSITHWRMARSQELFFLLLESVRPLSKDKLIDALWPNTTSKQIDTTMRTAIYYLRLVIGKACVVYDSGLYRLNLAALYGPEIWSDVALFETHYSQAKKALAVHDDEAARTAFTDLVMLYTGDYLQSFYNDWCMLRRSKLRLVYMDACEQLARLAWRQKRWDASIEHWHHLLSLDPCFESAHYWIMRIYLQQEKRELALRQYQLCCLRLQEDLQTTPGSTIQELYQRIK